jgi:hypothetical protein
MQTRTERFLGDDFKILQSKKPEMKSKGGSIFSRKNYKQTGKI